MPIEDHDLGWSKIEKQLKALAHKEVVVGVQGDEDKELVRYAKINEFGSEEWIIGSKQAYFMARRLMDIDPTAEPARFWGTYRSLLGKKMQIPERSYLRASIDANQDVIRKAMLRSFDLVAAGEKTADEQLQRFGMFLEALIKKWMVEFSDPPNAPLTRQLKGANNPLINSGRLKNSIRAVVRNETTGGKNGPD